MASRTVAARTALLGWAVGWFVAELLIGLEVGLWLELVLLPIAVLLTFPFVSALARWRRR